MIWNGVNLLDVDGGWEYVQRDSGKYDPSGVADDSCGCRTQNSKLLQLRLEGGGDKTLDSAHSDSKWKLHCRMKENRPSNYG